MVHCAVGVLMACVASIKDAKANNQSPIAEFKANWRENILFALRWLPLATWETIRSHHAAVREARDMR